MACGSVVPRRARCSSGVWCLCADALTTAFSFLMSGLLLVLSWHAFISKTKCFTGDSTAAYAYEIASVLLSAAGYWVLVNTALRCVRLPFLVRLAIWVVRHTLGNSRAAEGEVLRRQCDARPTTGDQGLKSDGSGDEETDGAVFHPATTSVKLTTTTTTAMPSAESASPLPRQTLPSTRPAPTASLAHRVARYPLTIALVLVLTVASIHVAVHHVVPAHHRLSQELLLATVRVGVDLAVTIVFGAAALLRGVRRSLRVGLVTRGQLHRGVALCTLLAAGLIGWGLSGVVVRAWRTNTYAHLTALILGGHADACEVVGMAFNASVTASTVWPAILPRRTLNFFTGSEQCGRHHRFLPLAFVDDEHDMLVVSPTCWDGHEVPRVYLERPIANDLYHFPHHIYAAAFEADLEHRFGNNKTSVTAEMADGVIVHRHRKTHRITEVEVDPSRLTRVTRAAARPGSIEARVRGRWVRTSPPLTVLTLPLGGSSTYFVRCPRLDPKYEELYLYPKLRARPLPAAAETAPSPTTRPTTATSEAKDDKAEVIGVTAPPGNVLFIVIDATSRQEVLRSLPQFTAWMRGFKARQAAKGPDEGGGYLVVEPAHHSIVGEDSNGNTPVFMTGSSFIQWRNVHAHHDPSKMDASDYTFTADAKRRYGDARIRTSLLHGMCEDLWRSGQSTPVHAGVGDRVTSTDMYIYTPFCHVDYGAWRGNLQGPFSIRKRCLDGRHIHEYMFDHTIYLMKHRMRHSVVPNSSSHSPAGVEYFFDMVYLMDAHEGTHATLKLIDADLAQFMDNLEKVVHFFDNPLNTFVLAADHGNHMGHYHMNDAGRFEHTNPALLMAFHPEVLRRVDAMKHQEEGTSARTLIARMAQFSSNLDTHLTFRDILGVPDLGVRLHEGTKVPPRSHFDRRDAEPHQCADYRIAEVVPCTLSFCHLRNTSDASRS